MMATGPVYGEETDSLFAPPEAHFVAPGRLFAATVPTGWTPSLLDENTVQFDATAQPGTARMIVRRLVVPSGASATQLLLKAIEERLSKLPAFQVLQRRTPEIAGIRGASVVGAYLFQGNAQYPRAVEEIVIVVGREAFLFHFECFRPASGYFADDLNAFYASFAPRPSGAEDYPFAPVRPESEERALDKIPF